MPVYRSQTFHKASAKRDRIFCAHPSRLWPRLAGVLPRSTDLAITRGLRSGRRHGSTPKQRELRTSQTWFDGSVFSSTAAGPPSSVTAQRCVCVVWACLCKCRCEDQSSSQGLVQGSLSASPLAHDGVLFVRITKPDVWGERAPSVETPTTEKSGVGSRQRHELCMVCNRLHRAGPMRGRRGRRGWRCVAARSATPADKKRGKTGNGQKRGMGERLACRSCPNGPRLARDGLASTNSLQLNLIRWQVGTPISRFWLTRAIEKKKKEKKRKRKLYGGKIRYRLSSTGLSCR